MRFATGAGDDGATESRSGTVFYSFRLEEAVSGDHLVRQIDNVIDLSWVHKELAPYYSDTGRPSIDPVLMIRMLIVGYVFAIRSERRICGDCRSIWPTGGFAARYRGQDTRSFGVLPCAA